MIKMMLEKCLGPPPSLRISTMPSGIMGLDKPTETVMVTTTRNHSGYRLPASEGLLWPSRRCWALPGKLLDKDWTILAFPLFRPLPKELPILPSHTPTTHPHRIKDRLPNLVRQSRQKTRNRKERRRRVVL
jgi:hypothetical protein